MFNVNNYYLQT